MGRSDLVCVGQSYGYLSFGLELVSANERGVQGRQPNLSQPALAHISPSLRHNSLTQTRYTKKRELKRAKLIFFFFQNRRRKKLKNLKNLIERFLKEKNTKKRKTDPILKWVKISID